MITLSYVLTDTSRAVVEGYQHDAYGRPVVFEPGANGVVDLGDDDLMVPGGAGQVGNPYQFTGRRLDAETGLFYYRARYMNAELGRFLSRDPIDYLDRINLHENAHSAPTKYVDPFGMKVSGFTDCGALTAAQRTK